jgi:ABC-2 type transport system permease protein
LPIYDLSYRHWTGEPGPRSRRWMPIAAAGLTPLFRRRSFILWLVVSWMPAVVAGVMVYFLAKVAGGEIDLGSSDLTEATAGFFHGFFRFQIVPALLTSVFVGSGLIANDRRTNALQIYLSKPLRKVDYLLGKGMAVAGALALVILAPPLAVFLLRLGLDSEGRYLRAHGTVALSILAGSLLIMLSLTIFSLTVSSLARSGRTAGVVLVMLYLFSGSFPPILGFILGRDAASLLSPVTNLWQGLDWAFGQPTRYDVHPLLSLAVLGAMLAACLWLLERRIRAVEVAP